MTSILTKIKRLLTTGQALINNIQAILLNRNERYNFNR